MPRGLGDSNGLWIVLLALLISAPISFVVLRGERDRASERIVRRVERAKADLEANRTQEDAADDTARAQGQTPGQAQARSRPRNVRHTAHHTRSAPAPSIRETGALCVLCVCLPSHLSK
ncbi:hypothetical protein SALBM217S_09125 [Streptomyces griseoloalbus]